MIDKNAIERTLLIGTVKQQNWAVLISNNITEEYFSAANRPMYRYIKQYIDENKYPDLKIMQYEFNIDDIAMGEYTSIQDLQSLCDTLHNDYVKSRLQFEVSKLNEFSDELDTNPYAYIDRIGNLYNNIRAIGTGAKSIGLFDKIEDILKIDSSNVITTGFKELDEKLIGWKRGEELVVLVARTGSGKSWTGLKFALAAALQGEAVGIYSGEMSTQQLQERMLCCAKQTYTSTNEEALQFIKDHDLNIRLLTQRELRRRANITDLENMIVRDRLTMLVVDQLSLMEDNTCKPGTPLRQQYGNISMDLFSLSTKYSLPIILLVQSNRQGNDSRNGPLLENIAESDAVAQNATRVISMKNENNVMTLNVVKNRYGDSVFTQKYDVDFSINKYKAIQEFNPDLASARQARVKQMFGRTF